MNLARAILTKTATMPTSVLKCVASSIHFPAGSDTPQITDPDTKTSLELASRQLHDRQVVAFPTETVYGLGALALETSAAARIFSTKGRPPDNPLIVHVSSSRMLQSLLPNDFILPPSYEILIRRFWPGPLTLLFPKSSLVPAIITAGQPTVAVRMPSHPVARALIALADAPIAAPSANSSGKPSPTKASHVLHDLDGKLDIILDGGACDVGLESTVVEGLQADGHLRVLRPGGVTVEDLESALKQGLGNDTAMKVLVHRRDYSDEQMEQAPTTPGMKYTHYSPSVPVVLLSTLSKSTSSHDTSSFKAYLQRLQDSREDSGRPLQVGLLALDDSPLLSYTQDSDALKWHTFPFGSSNQLSMAARQLFDGLLTLEKKNVDVILVEEVPETLEGLAVMNRVRKAAGETQWISV